MFTCGGQPYVSKKYSLIREALHVNITQCVPTEGCKLTIPAVVVNLSSLIYFPNEMFKIFEISFIFTLEVASFHLRKKFCSNFVLNFTLG